MQRPDYLRCLLAERIFNTNYRCKAVLDRHIEMRILLRQRIKQLLSCPPESYISHLQIQSDGFRSQRVCLRSAWKCRVRRCILPLNAFLHAADSASCAAFTTAFAIECGKCSSRHAAMRSSSSGSCPLNGLHLDNGRFCLRQRTRLIKYDCLRFCHGLQDTVRPLP